TGEKEELQCGILFRSIGYRGIPIEGLPFQEQAGIIPNHEGRVADSEHIYPGLYTAGWIKRGPSGIIGTNKPDAEETVRHLLEDIQNLNPCKNPSDEAVVELLQKNNVRYITFSDWKKIDAAEIERGQKIGKPREKLTSVEEMLDLLG
ncbi:MAG: NADP oxidoreductase, partial [Candidatus Omnitrophica bacterium]|nr:NADP oxidoreductase [Candidatus Omnitrophota bacterium]